MQQHKTFTKHLIYSSAIWIASSAALLLAGIPGHFVLLWSLLIPSGLLLFWFSYQRVLPYVFSKKSPLLKYCFAVTAIILFAYFPTAGIFMIYLRNYSTPLYFSFLISLFQFFITAPIGWLVFKSHLRSSVRITTLEKELVYSTATFDFLRSQINPHFLFNALNTIYSMALQEYAARTSEGIQKLGDMMRFMLQENMKEKISLAHELEYLNNYVSLQMLRIESRPSIKIDVQIMNFDQTAFIAPMMIIPFVENAFKHGISFRNPSEIRIKVEQLNDYLCIEVFNRKQTDTELEPEKGKSGIGIFNVRQRLQHLYPGKHELEIIESKNDFFISLKLSIE